LETNGKVFSGHHKPSQMSLYIATNNKTQIKIQKQIVKKIL